MKATRLMVITVAAVWLQVSFLGAWRPLGVLPDLFLVVLLIAATTLNNASEVLAMAVGGGLLLDIASGTDFGLRIAFFCFLALLLIMMRRHGTELERPAMRVAAVISATALYDAVVLLPLMSSKPMVFWGAAGFRVGSEILMNLALIALLVMPLRWLLNPRGVAAVQFTSQGKV